MKIPDNLTRLVGRQLLVGRKHAPHIMFVGGVAGVITSGVLACKATLKLHEKLDDFKAEIEEVKSEYYNPTMLAHRQYTLAENRKDLAYVYAKNTAKVVKLYAPAVVVGTVSVGLLTGSHVTLARRNAALAAAYTGLAETMAAYRKRVKEEVGEDKEKDLYYGVPVETNKKTGDQVIKVTDPSKRISPYSRWWDQSNPNWQNSPETNRHYIGLQIMYLNDTLKARGHVFLNEVYDELGLTHTQTGAVTGWIWPPRPGCDGEIVCDIMASRQEFQVGDEYQLLLDFNVDPGTIWNLIDP